MHVGVGVRVEAVARVWVGVAVGLRSGFHSSYSFQPVSVIRISSSLCANLPSVVFVRVRVWGVDGELRPHTDQ